MPTRRSSPANTRPRAERQLPLPSPVAGRGWTALLPGSDHDEHHLRRRRRLSRAGQDSARGRGAAADDFRRQSVRARLGVHARRATASPRSSGTSIRARHYPTGFEAAIKPRPGCATRRSLAAMAKCVDFLADELRLAAIGTMGFCLGGRYVFMLAAQDRRLGACASIYPSIHAPNCRPRTRMR